MNKQHLKWYLLVGFLLWGLSASLVLFQHQSARLQSASLAMLADEFDHFKRTLIASQNSRMEHLAELERGVVRVSSALHQVKDNSKTGFISNDLTQLIYLTDRFKNKASDYIGLQLNRRELSVQIEHETHHEALSVALPLYHELGSFLFSAFYANEHSDDVDYLVLESLLVRSHSLASPNKQKLQSLLSQTSTVLSEQAQIKLLSTSLLDSSIKSEISRINSGYVKQENALLYFSMLSGFAALLIVLASTLVGRSSSEAQNNDGITTMPKDNSHSLSKSVLVSNSKVDEVFDGETRQRTEHITNTNQQAPIKSHVESSPITNPAIEAVKTEDIPVPGATNHKIDISYMLDTFEQDTESVIMVLEVFLADHQNDGEKISQHFEQDRALALRTAHSLKGVAGNLGAVDLKNTAIRLEKTLEECSVLPVDLVTELNNDLACVVEDVLDYLETAK
ncbi:Hpt domain-containing protein [Vibrio tapetis subsp. quintayensis]|uniref:Hpt domain-containing protein n=1 Tax=Vibrio tapetis TaxID=52443 RepID=UPI0025B48B84|nr:Hpt domain-containing protein [Vibrio tapetis]MDN3680511.1 Hpt domain-containing protein [Vibrio tapetis subsp. quintayensis]